MLASLILVGWALALVVTGLAVGALAILLFLLAMLTEKEGVGCVAVAALIGCPCVIFIGFSVGAIGLLISLIGW